MNRSFTFPVLLVLLAMGTMMPVIGQSEADLKALPDLPEEIRISYPNSNPLRDAMKPIPETSVFRMDGFYLWDPSVIRVGDTYHLFCSRWPAEWGMQGWRRCHIIRATSKSLFGPYEFQEVVLRPSNHPWATQGVHNPKIMKVGDRFLLYHLGIPRWQTAFAFANSIEGPWEPVQDPVIPTNNPALIVREDGSAYAVGKFKPKITKDGMWDAYLQAFEADHFMGPYRLVKDTLNRLPGNLEHEDAAIWWANDQYNLICTDWEAKVTGVQKSVVFYTSKDGVDYELYSQIPVWSQEEPVTLENGKELRVDRVERPQVYLNKNRELIALLVSVHPDDESPTYILIRPVDRFMPGN